jgi:hypothetical protein
MAVSMRAPAMCTGIDAWFQVMLGSRIMCSVIGSTSRTTGLAPAATMASIVAV